MARVPRSPLLPDALGLGSRCCGAGAHQHENAGYGWSNRHRLAQDSGYMSDVLYAVLCGELSLTTHSSRRRRVQVAL